MSTSTKRTRFSRRLPDHVTDELVNALTIKKVYEFNTLFEAVYEQLKLRNAVSGGEEMLRLRAYEKLQNLVSRGLVEKIGKTYRGLEGIKNARTPIMPPMAPMGTVIPAPALAPVPVASVVVVAAKSVVATKAAVITKTVVATKTVVPAKPIARSKPIVRSKPIARAKSVVMAKSASRGKAAVVTKSGVRAKAAARK